MIDNTTKILKALGEPTRLKIIKVLSLRELCICEVVAILNMSQPRISQHVRVLKEAGLLTERKSKQNSYLTINRAVLDGNIIVPLQTVMQLGLADLAEMQEEYHRLLTLESNEEVIACKTRLSHPHQRIANNI